MKTAKKFAWRKFLMALRLTMRPQPMKYAIVCCIMLGSLLTVGGSSEAEPHKHGSSKPINRLPSTTGQWVRTAGPEGAFVGSILASGSNLFAGTSAGIFRSSDGGATWAASGLEGLNIQTFAVHGSSVFAGTSGNGVSFSTDGGESWTAINNGLTATTLYASS